MCVGLSVARSHTSKTNDSFVISFKNTIIMSSSSSLESSGTQLVRQAISQPIIWTPVPHDAQQEWHSLKPETTTKKGIAAEKNKSEREREREREMMRVSGGEQAKEEREH